MSYDTVVHLLAGGLGGTAGAVVTCPLEVVKTRLQSSVANFNYSYVPTYSQNTISSINCAGTQVNVCGWTDSAPVARHVLSDSNSLKFRSSLTIWGCIRHIVEAEGGHALFKGLGPNLVGVIPARAIYFCTYSSTKRFWNDCLTPDTPAVHILSAAAAGFASCTATNPVWFIKTRLQLDQRKYGSVSSMQCIKDIYTNQGIKGFYKGITASYFGISETIIHFVIYEFIKASLQERRKHDEYKVKNEKSTRDFLECMLAGAISKTCASVIAYPHEVVRTRLRQAGNKYNSFFQTLFLVFQEENYHGLYRGLGTQLVRQIPNTAIMMATYEAVVYVFSC